LEIRILIFKQPIRSDPALCSKKIFHESFYVQLAFDYTQCLKIWELRGTESHKNWAEGTGVIRVYPITASPQ